MEHVEYRQLSDLSNVQIMKLLFKKIAMFSCLARRAPILFGTFYSWIGENKMDFNQIAILILKVRQELSACLSWWSKASCCIRHLINMFDCKAKTFSHFESPSLVSDRIAI